MRMELQMINRKVEPFIQEIKLVYRPFEIDIPNRSVTCSRDVYALALELWNFDTIGLFEEFKVVLTNAKGKVIGVIALGSGGIDGVVVDARLIFAPAIKAVAHSIFLLHNHPSGDIKPSHSDTDFTKKIVAGGAMLNIKVKDHLIISNSEYYSFCDHGIL